MSKRNLNLKTFFSNHYLFLIILFLSIFLRTYKLNELTTFGGDQGVDFLVVRDMVLFHKWTLLGMKTSIAPFFQGPLYLYMLYPFFLLFHLQPIAGGVAAVTVSIATIILLYITVRKYFSQKIAILSTLLFAVSPELIIYGNTPLYQNFLPLFIVLSIYLFLIKKKNFIVNILLGLSAGLGMELHFLNVSLALSIFLFFIFFEKEKIKAAKTYIIGLVAGLSPTIAFELRHGFLNTNLFLNYQQNQHTTVSITNIFKQWIRGSAMFLGGNNLLIGAFVLISTIVFLLVVKVTNTPHYIKLKKLTLLTISVLVLLILIISTFGPEYALPVWILFLIILPLVITNVFPNKIGVGIVGLLIILNLVSSVKELNNNHGYNMPDGWTMTKIILAGKIISGDVLSHPNFNVASLIDGGTRAYPIRYAIIIAGGKPEAVENYPQNNFLYVVSDSNKYKIKKANSPWEIVAFSPFTIGAEWDLGENIYLYRLDKTLSQNE